MEKRLANQDGVGWIPEGIILLVQYRQLSIIKEVLEQLSDNEEPIFKHIQVPLVNVVFFIIFNFNFYLSLTNILL